MSPAGRARDRHVVLERHRVGHEWRELRWTQLLYSELDAFAGFPYRGGDPDGFMAAEIVRT